MLLERADSRGARQKGSHGFSGARVSHSEDHGKHPQRTDCYFN